MNKIIRVCARKHAEFENVALTQASIILIFNDTNTFAYGVVIKNHGGGQFSDYHIIGSNMGNNSWKFNAGNFSPFDGFYDDYANTGSIFTDFDIEQAKTIFDSTDQGSLYDLHNKFNRTVDSDGVIEQSFSDKEKKVFGFDNEEYPGYPDESGEYYYSKLCLLEDINGAISEQELLWYSLNDCDQEALKNIETNDAIQAISKMTPGNIDFLR